MPCSDFQLLSGLSLTQLLVFSIRSLKLFYPFFQSLHLFFIGYRLSPPVERSSRDNLPLSLLYLGTMQLFALSMSCAAYCHFVRMTMVSIVFAPGECMSTREESRLHVNRRESHKWSSNVFVESTREWSKQPESYL